MFIEEFLKHHGIRASFEQGVSTNGGGFTDDGRLDVQPYHTNQDEPHGCSLCPPNLCKGESNMCQGESNTRKGDVIRETCEAIL